MTYSDGGLNVANKSRIWNRMIESLVHIEGQLIDYSMGKSSANPCYSSRGIEWYLNGAILVLAATEQQQTASFRTNLRKHASAMPLSLTSTKECNVDVWRIQLRSEASWRSECVLGDLVVPLHSATPNLLKQTFEEQTRCNEPKRVQYRNKDLSFRRLTTTFP